MDNSIGIGDLAAILTAAGVTVYVLGLVGLALPIRRAFTGDLSTAWYAVALVPKTVVAGQGVRIWLALPVGLTAVLLVLSTLVPSQVLVVVLVVVFLWVWGRSRRKEMENQDFYLLYLPLWLVAGLAIGYGRCFLPSPWQVCDVPSFLSFLPSDGPALVGILLVFLASFLLGLPAAIAADHSLPEVKITQKDQDRGEKVPDTPKGNQDAEGKDSEQPKGYLVAHSDGFWHLFDKNKNLLSIPDDEVASVRVVGKL